MVYFITQQSVRLSDNETVNAGRDSCAATAALKQSKELFLNMENFVKNKCTNLGNRIGLLKKCNFSLGNNEKLNFDLKF